MIILMKLLLRLCVKMQKAKKFYRQKLLYCKLIFQDIPFLTCRNIWAFLHRRKRLSRLGCEKWNSLLICSRLHTQPFYSLGINRKISILLECISYSWQTLNKSEMMHSPRMNHEYKLCETRDVEFLTSYWFY